MKREIGWLMLAKLAALVIVWALFFSPAHWLAVNGSVTADRLALGPAPDTQLGSAPYMENIPVIDFDVVGLSRLQFALTALYRYLFVPLTLGL